MYMQEMIASWVNTDICPLAPHSPDSLITRANLVRRMPFFYKKGFGKCLQLGKHYVMTSVEFDKFG
jgi:hypothetical protein